jgi:hypothetical protein
MNPPLFTGALPAEYRTPEFAGRDGWEAAKTGMGAYTLPNSHRRLEQLVRPADSRTDVIPDPEKE